MHTDYVVEERLWRQGVEMVSHVNHSQVARVRTALGVVHEQWRFPLLSRPQLYPLPSARGRRAPLSEIPVATGGAVHVAAG